MLRRAGEKARWRSALVALVFACLAGTVYADDRAVARQAYERGTAAHRRGDFATAAAEFASADKRAPSQAALQAAIDAAIAADDPVLGAELLDRSKREPMGRPLAASAKRAAEKLGGRAGRVQIVCEAACDATIDGVVAIAGAPVWVRLGKHAVIVRTPVGEKSAIIDVVPDAILEVRGPVTPPPAPPASTTAPAASAPSPPASAAPPPALVPAHRLRPRPHTWTRRRDRPRAPVSPRHGSGSEQGLPLWWAPWPRRPASTPRTSMVAS